MQQVDLHGLPPCSLSIHCLRLLDDLDDPDITQKFRQVSLTEDEHLLGQLRTHLPDCPTCSAVLAKARRVRAQQRAVLRELLNESEASVASTTAQVLAVIHRGQESGSRPGSLDKRVGYYLQEIAITPGVPELNDNHHELRPGSHSWLLSALTLATVAAVVLFAIGILDHYFSRPEPAGKVVDSNGWNSVVVGLTLAAPGVARLMGIYNYNPASGKRTELVPSSQAPADVQLDGVSPDGHNLLYQASTNGHTLYSTLVPVNGKGFFYELNDVDAGNAIWMDSGRVLVATVHSGVELVDIHTGVSKNLFPTLRVDRLVFYHNPYMYFVGASALYRINSVSADSTPQVVTISAAGKGSSFWLSPDGLTIYYADSEDTGGPGIHSVSSDGTRAVEVLSGDVTPAGYVEPIGFADDNSLEAIRVSSGKFQVIKYAASGEQFQIVVDDAAPQAISLCGAEVAAPMCDGNVVLAPSGHGLVVNAFYPDGYQRVWFDDLATGKKSLLMKLASDMHVQLPGWDRIPVAAA